MSVVSHGLLRWTRGPLPWAVDSPGPNWHLTFNGRDVLCGLKHWGGPPLRVFTRSLHGEPPKNICPGCQDGAAKKMGLR